MIKVSIITVVYNSKNNISKTIESVINQTYKNYEYIIIDGGSTNGTLDIINDYSASISKIISESDKGIYDAMNKEINFAIGDWVYFLNSGDVFFSNETIKKIFSLEQKSGLIYGKHKVDYGYFTRVHTPLSLEKIREGMIFSHQSMFVKL